MKIYPTINGKIVGRTTDAMAKKSKPIVVRSPVERTTVLRVRGGPHADKKKQAKRLACRGNRSDDPQ